MVGLLVGTERLVVCFVDVRNWSQAMEGKPDEAVFEFLSDFHETVLPIAENHEGRIVRVSGEAAMIIFKPQDAARAIEAGRAMRSRFDHIQAGAEPVVPLELSVAMDVGAVAVEAIGPPAIRRWEITGRPVSTVTKLSGAGGFVITEAVAELADTLDFADTEIVENQQEDEA